MNYFKIKEDSLFARVAAKKLKGKRMAMVLGSTIHLYGVSKADFLNNDTWLRHELKHVEQFRQHGYLPFLIKYVWQSFKHGYYKCSFEQEARAAENDEFLLAKYKLSVGKRDVA